MAVNMLTTIDNPFNPFTEYDEWLAYDESKGYYSNGLLARITVSTDELSDAVENSAREAAIDEIIQKDPLGIYVKVPEPK